MKLNTSDYILIAVGLLMLPIFIGLVILGVAIWRIGCRMEKESEISESETSEESYSQNADALPSEQPTMKYTEDDMESFAPQFLDKRYKLKQYSEDTLENGK